MPVSLIQNIKRVAPSIVAGDFSACQDTRAQIGVAGVLQPFNGLGGFSFLTLNGNATCQVFGIGSSSIPRPYLRCSPPVAVDRDVTFRFAIEADDAAYLIRRPLTLGFNFAADITSPGPFIITALLSRASQRNQFFPALVPLSEGVAVNFVPTVPVYSNSAAPFRVTMPLELLTGVLTDLDALYGLVIEIRIQTLPGTGNWYLWDIALNDTGEFVPSTFAELLRRSLRYYVKSFEFQTNPATGITNNAIEFVATTAGAVAVTTPAFKYPVPMMQPYLGGIWYPNVTIYNPVNANNQVRNMTLGADCTFTVAVSTVGESGFNLGFTQPVGTAIGDIFAFHYEAYAFYFR